MVVTNAGKALLEIVATRLDGYCEAKGLHYRKSSADSTYVAHPWT